MESTALISSTILRALATGTLDDCQRPTVDVLLAQKPLYRNRTRRAWQYQHNGRAAAFAIATRAVHEFDPDTMRSIDSVRIGAPP